MNDSGLTWWVLIPLYGTPKAHYIFSIGQEAVRSACGRFIYWSEWVSRQPDTGAYPKCKTCLKLEGKG